MSASDAEKEVYARLRAACVRSSHEEIAAQRAALASPPRVAPDPEKLLASFDENLTRNGASLRVASGRAAAVQELSQYIAARHGQRRVTAGHDPRLAALPWRDGGLLPRFGGAQAGDGAAVSYANCGIAETGSLAVWINRDNPALNNLLAEDHIIFLDEKDLRSRLEDIWLRPPEKELARDAREAGHQSNAKRLPRGLMLISGPSSTADIGMKLVLGAHGPRSLHVIVVRPGA